MKKFIKKVENFVCENCKKEIVGNGYTNHCPYCLYSKHIDINPGDRSCDCLGLMEPIDILQKNGEFIILHKCQKCNFERKNKVEENDDFSVVVKISKNNK